MEDERFWLLGVVDPETYYLGHRRLLLTRADVTTWMFHDGLHEKLQACDPPLTSTAARDLSPPSTDSAMDFDTPLEESSAPSNISKEN